MRHIGALYRIEEQLRAQRAGPGLRQVVRGVQSAPILKRLKKALELVRPRYFPQNAMGKAITYALEQWPQLLAYIEDGRIEIDNNIVENAIRPTAIGKNYVQSAVMRRWRQRVAFLLPFRRHFG